MEDFTTIPTISIPTILYKAILVMNGAYGDGEERKSNLGTDYERVQLIVNVISKYWD